MSKIVTLQERKSQRIRLREKLISDFLSALREATSEYTGCFYLFGSVARGNIKEHSDVDMFASFPPDEIKRALACAEEISLGIGVPIDIVEPRWADERLMRTITPDMRLL